MCSAFTKIPKHNKGLFLLKKIFILLTKSQTTISKVIALTTKDVYTHASISFNNSLYPMYSFSREHIHIPLPARIRIEPLFSGFYEKFDNIPCALYETEVDDNKYQNAKTMVEEMFDNRKEYGYNIIGLFCCRLGLAFERKNKFFCSQFVGKVLTDEDIVEMPKPPSLIRPNDFSNTKELKCIYQGNLHELKEILLKQRICSN